MNSWITRWKLLSRKSKLLAISALVFGGISIWYYNCLPERIFNDPYSTVLEASDGELLCASIADDGQWRFPQRSKLPAKFVQALIEFEDKRFYSHPGVDVLSLARAVRQNLSSGKIISGGSTITMQVVRIAGKERNRSVTAKLYETILATRLELSFSKDEILQLYAAHAPFGGNVVGLEAACWRYFNTDPEDLSWGQASLLAVLPNAPGMIHPGKNRGALKKKRDRLLDKLVDSGVIDQTTGELAKEESIPDQPYSLPDHARHLLVKAMKTGRKGQRIRSTIDVSLQIKVEDLVRASHLRLRNNHINNAAALIIDVQSGAVRAYVGNVPGTDVPEQQVDIIHARRSTGSILKPFLYAAMLDEGKILPKSLLPDVPVLLNGFSPKNFSHGYDGAVPADKSLIRSLNVPAVHMLRDYRFEKFHSLLKDLGMTTLTQSPDHYGLSLILGGAEGTLWDITGMYASMGRVLKNYFRHPGKNRYHSADFHGPLFTYESEGDTIADTDHAFLSAASIHTTLETLKELYRPGEDAGWKYFSSARQVSWKTGTSFGFRDAWAVGVTPDVAVGVWVGNADGEGRPGLTGTDAAAPIMFDIFSVLPQGAGSFGLPRPEMRSAVVCNRSGMRAGSHCTERDTLLIPVAGLKTTSCTYHKLVHLSADARFQVHDQCESLARVKHIEWFVLPPVQEFYYKSVHSDYKTLPPLRNDCGFTSNNVMDMIYPKNNTTVFIPRELDGSRGTSVFQAAHRDPAATVFWHLDGNFVAATKSIHHLPLNPQPGKHVLTLVDEKGSEIVRNFVVLSSGK